MVFGYYVCFFPWRSSTLPRICVKMTLRRIKLTQNRSSNQMVNQYSCQPDPQMGQAPWNHESGSVFWPESFWSVAFGCPCLIYNWYNACLFYIFCGLRHVCYIMLYLARKLTHCATIGKQLYTVTSAYVFLGRLRYQSIILCCKMRDELYKWPTGYVASENINWKICDVTAVIIPKI